MKQHVLMLDAHTNPREMVVRPMTKLVGLRGYTKAMRSVGASYKDDVGWVLPLRYIKQLSDICTENSWAIHPTEALHAALSREHALLEALKLSARDRWDLFQGELREYQKKGAQTLAENHRFLLADDMGLGKTIQVLAALPPNVPVVIFCPKVVKRNWANEFARFRPDYKVTVIKNKKSFLWPKPGEAIIANFEQIPEVHGGIGLPGEMHMVLDECHAFKKYNSQRTQKVRRLVGRCKVVWGLTGTPLESLPPDLWGVLQTLGTRKLAFQSWRQFVRLFQGTELILGGIEWKKDPLPEAAHNLSRVMLRREKEKVLDDLPERSRNDFYIDIAQGQTHVWKAASEQFERFVSSTGVPDLRSISFSDAIATARADLALLKARECKPLIEVYKEANIPLVVFTAHRAVVDHIQSLYPEASIVVGGQKEETKTSNIEKFQKGSPDEWGLFIATIQAAGVGLTLTRAAHALVIDSTWVESQNLQAEDRIYRFGQKRHVTITRLIANHKVDEQVHRVLDYKKRLAEKSYRNTVESARDLASEVGIELVNIERVVQARKAGITKPDPRYRPALTKQEIWAETYLKHYLLTAPHILSLTDKEYLDDMKTILETRGGLTRSLWEVLITRIERYRKKPEQDENELEDAEFHHYHQKSSTQ